MKAMRIAAVLAMAVVEFVSAAHAASLVAGFDHNLAVVGGKVWGWGGNTGGKLGNGSTSNSVYPVQAGTLTGVTDVAAGMDWSLARTSTGAVYAWGLNDVGQLGVGTTSTNCTVPGTGTKLCEKSPVLVSGITNVSAIGAGWGHSVALKSDGTVWTWGSTQDSALGRTGTANVPGQVTITGNPVITKIAVGYFHTVVLTAGGTLYAWGDNSHGELGHDPFSEFFTSNTPVAVPGLTNVVDIASRGGFTLALTGDGTVWVWGSGIYGQSGDGNTDFSDMTAPQAVTIGGTGSIVEMAAGFGFALVRRSDGTVWAWGLNKSGQLGSTSNYFFCGSASNLNCDLPPVHVTAFDGATAIYAGGAHTLVKRANGNLSGFGDNDSGQLGNQSGNYSPPRSFGNATYDPSGTLFPQGTFGSGSSIGTGSTSGDLNVGNLDTGVYFASGIIGTPTASSTVTVSNISATDPFNVTSVSTSSEFPNTNNCVGTLNASSSCTINVSFNASASGQRQGTLTIGTDIPDSASISVTLNGVGVSNDPSLSALTLSSGTLSPAFAPATTSYTATVGSTVSSINVTPSTTNAGATVSVNGSGYAAGGTPRAVSLSVGSNPVSIAVKAEDTVTTRTYNVNVTRLNPPIASVSPSSLGFSSQNVSTTSASQPVTLSNTGGDTLNISSIGKSGTNAGDFGVTHNCPASLAPTTGSCQINVTFTPGDVGPRGATLSISTDDPSNPTRNVTLSGTGASPGPFTLTVSRAGTGAGTVTSSPSGIACGPTCSAPFANATVVTLTAVQDVSSTLASWSGCGSVNAARQCVVTMNAAASVTATFRPSGGSATDFNADGHPDIVWSNTANGATYVWYMAGTPPALITDAFIAQIDPSWRVQGVADFNGDGKPDLVWRNTANGNCYVWYMNGTAFITDAFLFGLPPQWVIQGVADFNGDGHPDFLMRNTDPASGVGFAWYFNNATAIGSDFLFGIDPTWKVEQVADVNGDGQPDLLFRNTSSGLSFAWYTQYSGGVLSLAGSTPALYSIDPVWEVVQLADWNGDGQPDLLFRNASTGVVFVWYMNGTALAGSDFVIQIDPSWEIVPRR